MSPATTECTRVTERQMLSHLSYGCDWHSRHGHRSQSDRTGQGEMTSTAVDDFSSASQSYCCETLQRTCQSTYTHSPDDDTTTCWLDTSTIRHRITQPTFPYKTLLLCHNHSYPIKIRKQISYIPCALFN